MLTNSLSEVVIFIIVSVVVLAFTTSMPKYLIGIYEINYFEIMVEFCSR